MTKLNGGIMRLVATETDEAIRAEETAIETERARTTQQFEEQCARVENRTMAYRLCGMLVQLAGTTEAWDLYLPGQCGGRRRRQLHLSTSRDECGRSRPCSCGSAWPGTKCKRRVSLETRRRLPTTERQRMRPNIDCKTPPDAGIGVPVGCPSGVTCPLET